MKILFINPWLATGGLERALVNLANALVKRGHEVIIKTIDNNSELVPQLNERVRYIAVPRKQFPIVFKIKGSWRIFNFENWFKFSSPRTVYKYYVGTEKYDVEVAFFRGYPIKIISGSTNKDSIKLAWVHSDSMECAGMSMGFISFKQAAKAYKRFNKIICVSKQAQEKFLQRMGNFDNICTIYNINNIKNIVSKSEEFLENKYLFDLDKFKIIAVGHLIRSKGFERLFEVCKRLNEDKLDYTLTIVGEGSDRDILRRYIEENKLDNVFLVGLQENPYKFMKHADLLVCSSYYEGYNLTIAESLIIGTPVLSTNCTGPCEILDNGEYGMIVENSTEGLYQGIKKIMTDKDLYLHYKENTVKRLPFFDENRIINEVENLFTYE
ncbi:MAG: glycosyltransferase [Clostridiaceae bacterium]